MSDHKASSSKQNETKVPYVSQDQPTKWYTEYPDLDYPPEGHSYTPEGTRVEGTRWVYNTGWNMAKASADIDAKEAKKKKKKEAQGKK